MCDARLPQSGLVSTTGASSINIVDTRREVKKQNCAPSELAWAGYGGDEPVAAALRLPPARAHVRGHSPRRHHPPSGDQRARRK